METIPKKLPDEALKSKILELLKTANKPAAAQEFVDYWKDPNIDLHQVNSALYSLNNQRLVWRYPGNPVTWSTMDQKRQLEGKPQKVYKSTPELQETVFLLLQGAERPVTEKELLDYLVQKMPELTPTNIKSALGVLSSTKRIPKSDSQLWMSWDLWRKSRENKDEREQLMSQLLTKLQTKSIQELRDLNSKI